MVNFAPFTWEDICVMIFTLPIDRYESIMWEIQFLLPKEEF